MESAMREAALPQFRLTVVALPIWPLITLGWAKSAQAQLGDRIRINGYSSLELEKSISSEGRGDPNGSFDSDLVDLVLNFRPTDRFRIAVDSTWEHGVASEDGHGNAAPECRFAGYTVSEALMTRVSAYPGGGFVIGASFYLDHEAEFADDDATGSQTRVRGYGGRAAWNGRGLGLES